MKVLSLTQPWAQLVVEGHKKFETRSWGTSYRGWLGIHASKGFPRDCQRLLQEEPFLTALNCPPEELDRGAIVGVVRLTGCQSTVSKLLPDEPELSFGDYSPGLEQTILEEEGIPVSEELKHG